MNTQTHTDAHLHVLKHKRSDTGILECARKVIIAAATHTQIALPNAHGTHTRSDSGILDCARKVAAAEGPLAFYR
jgi:hypothetical protein